MSKHLPKLLVTGGAGFIGSAFVRLAVEQGYKVAIIDKLTYAGDKIRLKSVIKHVDFHKADIVNNQKVDLIFNAYRPDAVIHFAAETHVDRSILNAKPFLETNITGTFNLITAAEKYNVKRFIHISTDEVYGEITKGAFTETSPLKPNNPYSASKASADLLVQSFIRTHQLPGIIIRPCNNYGPWQYPEKFIPVILYKAIHSQQIPIYGKGTNIREWLYVSDCANAILTIFKKGSVGEIYNISSGEERKNTQVVQTALKILGKPASLMSYVKDRPGHDLRYCSECSKLKKLGWKESHVFETGLEKTILWAEENHNWMNQKADELKAYWKKIYKRS